jgi:signal transduction histidine kinase
MDAEQTSRLAQLFMGVLGHDLRNPLSAIMTGASYLKRISTGEKQSRTIERISASGDRMARMIEQLLDVTRFGIGGGIVLDIKRVDVADICRNVIEELTTAHAHRAIRCDVIDGTVGDWDPIRLGQAISNLVGNAVQHGAPGAPITLRVEGQPNEVVLTLHNEGAIDAALLPRIFAPFKRHHGDAPASGASSGLGLGLYISQQIIQAHRGAIEVSSSPATGTTFVVTLPRNAAQAASPSRGVGGGAST